VWRHLLALGLQGAEVDQPADLRLAGGLPHDLRRPPVGLLERGARTEGVDQVVDDVHAGAGGGHLARVVGVGPDDLDPARPRVVAHALR
jgi:hypothetical protein